MYHFQKSLFFLQIFLFLDLSADEHIELKIETNHWICLVCLKEYKNKRNARRHFKEIHAETNKSQCPFCEKWFDNERYKDKHVTRFHKDWNL